MRTCLMASAPSVRRFVSGIFRSGLSVCCRLEASPAWGQDQDDIVIMPYTSAQRKTPRPVRASHQPDYVEGRYPECDAGSRENDRGSAPTTARNRSRHGRQLLLIRLFQQATICSVGVWHALRFPRICASSNGNSLPRRHVKTTWRYVAGRTASHVPAADTGGRIGYCDIDGGNALGADTRFR